MDCSINNKGILLIYALRVYCKGFCPAMNMFMQYVAKQRLAKWNTDLLVISGYIFSIPGLISTNPGPYCSSLVKKRSNALPFCELMPHDLMCMQQTWSKYSFSFLLPLFNCESNICSNTLNVRHPSLCL